MPAQGHYLAIHDVVEIDYVSFRIIRTDTAYHLEF
jgi:hypothetical protein